MAILESLLGVEVTIWSGSAILTEYDDEDDEVRQKWKHKTVSKYIESKTDAEFFFRLKVTRPYEHDCDELGFAIILDGCEENVDSHLCGRDSLEDGGEWEFDVNGVETHEPGIVKLKKFKFSKILTTDDATIPIRMSDKDKVQKIGQIEVRVHQLQHSRSTKLKPKQLRGALDVIPEKWFGGQAISHSISYDSEEVLPAPSFYQGTKYMHGWDGPIGVFRFKYRSREDLQKELIIPRDPSPESPRPPIAAELTSEQKLRLARMRYDDLEMLRTLTAVSTAQARKTDIPTRSTFEELTQKEIDRFALEKHAEMTGIPIAKLESSSAIKKEPSIGGRSPIGPSVGRRRMLPLLSKAGQKHTIDLTNDNEDKVEQDQRFLTPRSHTLEDEIEIYAVRKVKKPKTGFGVDAGGGGERPSEIKRER